MRIVLAVTGASGMPYLMRFARAYHDLGNEFYLVVSEEGRRVLEYESPGGYDELRGMALEEYSNSDLWAPIASGSVKYDALVIVPCSMSTLSAISVGLAETLIQRVAAVCMKEGRRVVLVPRETPLSQPMIEAMLRCSRYGCTILPAMPPFYHKPRRLEDIIDYMAGRILRSLGIDSELYAEWSGRR